MTEKYHFDRGFLSKQFQALHSFGAVTLPGLLDRLERFMELGGDPSSPYAAGGSALTYADILLADVLLHAQACPVCSCVPVFLYP